MINVFSAMFSESFDLFYVCGGFCCCLLGGFFVFTDSHNVDKDRKHGRYEIPQDSNHGYMVHILTCYQCAQWVEILKWNGKHMHMILENTFFASIFMPFNQRWTGSR